MENETKITNDQIVLDGYDVTKVFKDDLIAERQMNAKKGMLNQLEIAKYNFRNPPKMTDCLGQTVASIDEDIFHETIIQERIRTGDPTYMCWDDPDWLKWFVKNNEAVQVKSLSINNSFVMDGFKDGVAV